MPVPLPALDARPWSCIIPGGMPLAICCPSSRLAAAFLVACDTPIVELARAAGVGSRIGMQLASLPPPITHQCMAAHLSILSFGRFQPPRTLICHLRGWHLGTFPCWGPTVALGERSYGSSVVEAILPATPSCCDLLVRCWLAGFSSTS